MCSSSQASGGSCWRTGRRGWGAIPRRASPSRSRPSAWSSSASPRGSRTRCLARSKAWEGLALRPLLAPGREAQTLFAFVGAWAPPEAAVERGWAAWDERRLVGALLWERAGSAALLHGPVVLSPEAAGSAAEPSDAKAEQEAAVEVAARLLSLAMDEMAPRGVDTLFARPQGLDRLWVRF